MKSLLDTKWLAVLVCLALLGSTGCMSMGLSEEAKPQTPEEHWVVAVQEYRFLADQAREWLVGVTEAARMGDASAVQYRETAIKIGEALSDGNKAIQLGSAALAAGDAEGLERHAQQLDRLILQLQAAGFASAGE